MNYKEKQVRLEQKWDLIDGNPKFEPDWNIIEEGVGV